MKSLILLLVTIFLNFSANATDLKIQKNIAYNGGDRLGDLCTLTLIESNGGSYSLLIEGPIHSAFNGVGRVFIAKKINESQIAAVGSTQTYDGERPINHPDENLTVNLNEDGTPDSYQIKSHKSGLKCTDLANAPY